MRIEKDTLAFLHELEQNNNRPWFEQNRDRYEAAKTNFEEFTQALIDATIPLDPALVELTPQQAIFRIYRDVRFAKDKRPYKPWFGAVITKGGRKYQRAGYYIRIAPNKSFVGGGYYKPTAANLAAIRRRIEKKGDDLRALTAAASFKKYLGELQGEQVKTAPKGYTQDHPQIDLLRYKYYFMTRELTDKQVFSPRLITTATTTYKAMQPVNTFLNEAIGT